MKRQFALASLVLVSTLGQASSRVCAGEKIYVSDIRKDYGTKPPQGALLSSHIIVYDRAILLKYDAHQGLHPQGVPPYRVIFDTKQNVLEDIQEPGQTKKTYSVEATVQKVDSLSHKVLEDLGQEEVTCRVVENLVP